MNICYNDFTGFSGIPPSNTGIGCGVPNNGNMDADPLFDTGACFPLQSGSPCIDVGYNSAPGIPSDDCTGGQRIRNGVVDMGAFEYGGEPTCTDNDNDGYYAEAGCGTLVDCNDNDDTIYPGANELCDGEDNDCDGVVDEGCPTCTDNDNDGYYAEAGCGTLVDCNDNDDTIYPGAPEQCDEKDNDCDGQVDEDNVCGGNECACPEDNTPPMGCISGTVTEFGTGEKLAGKKVILVRRGLPRAKWKTQTDNNGCYNFTDLVDGKYKVKLKRRECGRVREKVTFESGNRVHNNVNLECK